MEEVIVAATIQRFDKAKFTYAMGAALLVGPGVLPFIASLLAAWGLLKIPSSVNPAIFESIAVLLYCVCMPLLLLLYKFRARLLFYPLLAAVLPLAIFALLSLIRPISTLEDEALARSIFSFGAYFVGAFGAFAGSVFALAVRASVK